MKRILLWISIVIAVAALALGAIYGPKISAMMKVTVVDLDPHAKVILGGGGNSLLLTSPDNRQALIVDTKVKKTAGTLAALVAQLGPDLKLTVVNTHFHSDHTGGNGLFPKATLIAGKYDEGFWTRQTGSRLPDVTLAAGEEREIDLGGGEVVRLWNLGRGHTQNDLVVYIPSRKLLMTGDLMFNRIHPFVIKDSGAGVADWIKDLDAILGKYDIQTVIPGHGALSDRAGLIAERDYFADLTEAARHPERIPEMRKKYEAYPGMPGLTGFDTTLKFIRDELKAAQGK